jgi:hypothetical protein
MQTEKFYAVDRMQRKYVVLVGDAGHEVTVARAELPARLKEGVVLRVPVGEQGDLDWPAANGESGDIMLGDILIRERGSAHLIDRADRQLPPGSTKPLTIEFDWQVEPTQYTLTLDFGGGCVLVGEW